MILLYMASIGYKTTCYLLHKTLSCTDEIHTKHLCRMARPFVFRYCASVLPKKWVWELAYTEVEETSYGDFRLTPLIVLLEKGW